MKTAITSLMALMVSLTIALAGNGWGQGGTPPPSDGGIKGLGTQVAHYTSSYTDPVFGPVTCTGVHQTGKNFGYWGQDSFTCTAQPAGAVLPNVSSNQTITVGFGGWYSDYYFLLNQFVLGALNGVVSSDGTSYTAVANY